MKYYVKPSIEVSKFEVEDIMTLSSGGTEGKAGAAGVEAKDAYASFLAGNTGEADGTANLVEFMW